MEHKDTLKQSIQLMQKKILANEEAFKSAPLTIDPEMGDGRIITRPNPFVQEYRALVKDYASALRAYKELSGDEAPAETNKLADIRARFKVG